MKKIILTQATLALFISELQNLAQKSSSIIGVTGLRETKGRGVKKPVYLLKQALTYKNTIENTLEKSFLEVKKECVSIQNPGNAGFGYATIDFNFGETIYFVGNSIIWNDEGIRRRIIFSKKPGEARAHHRKSIQEFNERIKGEKISLS